MKIIFIILFLILILITTSMVEIYIEKLEVVKNKIKFLIKIKVYIFKHILIFSKKIRKKDILKFINFSEEKGIIKAETKIAKKTPMELVTLDLDINYGLNYIYSNIFIYAILNAIIPTLIYKYSTPKTKINYNITTDFKKIYFHIKLSAKIKIRVIKIIRNTLKAKRKRR